MRVLGFIPARSGSKGVPDKNIKPIKGIPLIEFTVFAAVIAKSKKILSDVIVSTDSHEYLSHVKHYDIERDYLRPKDLATDSAPTIDAVIDALNWYQEHKGKSFDAVMILQPTTPFRTLEHIANSIEMMKNTPSATCVASICKLGDHHPMRIKKMTAEGQLLDFCSDYVEPEPSRRQDFSPDAYIRNGAIYLTRTKTLQDEGVIRGSWVAGMEMPEANSINVDEHMDYLIAKASLEYDRFAEELSFFNDLISQKEQA